MMQTQARRRQQQTTQPGKRQKRATLSLNDHHVPLTGGSEGHGHSSSSHGHGSRPGSSSHGHGMHAVTPDVRAKVVRELAGEACPKGVARRDLEHAEQLAYEGSSTPAEYCRRCVQAAAYMIKRAEQPQPQRQPAVEPRAMERPGCWSGPEPELLYVTGSAAAAAWPVTFCPVPACPAPGWCG